MFITALCLWLVCGTAYAAQPLLADEELASALSLPAQPDVPGLVDFSLELRSEQGDTTLYIVTHFPQGISPKVDEAIAGVALTLHAQGYMNLQEGGSFSCLQYLKGLSQDIAARKYTVAPPRSPRSWGNSFSELSTWQVYASSPAYASVVFRRYITGGAHGNWEYRTVSYAKATGAELVLEDVFSDASMLPALSEKMVERIVQERKAKGKAIELDVESVDISMDRMALTPEGIRFFYAPYELAAYSEGEFIVDVSKEEAIRFGAKAELWSSGK